MQEEISLRRGQGEGVGITATEGKTREDGRKLASSYALGGLGLGTPSPDKVLRPEEERESPEAALSCFF